MIQFLWPLVRRVIRLRRGRMPPARLSDPLWYFAFGGNMNEQIFRERRHMTPVESCVGRLPDYRLVFTQAGGMQPGKSAPANIVNAPGNAVYGVLYLLPLRDFARLDNSEGKQYDYLCVDVINDAGKRIRALTYTVPIAAPEGRPGPRYLKTIRDAARQRGFPSQYIDFLGRIESR